MQRAIEVVQRLGAVAMPPIFFNGSFTEAALCRALYPAPAVLSGVFELFELLLAYTFTAFSDVPLASLLDNTAPSVSPNFEIPAWALWMDVRGFRPFNPGPSAVQRSGCHPEFAADP